MQVSEDNKLKPKKSLGQNFLVDKNILLKIKKIILASNPSGNCIEIGGGTGKLTEILQDIYKEITTIEIDKSLCEILTKKFSKNKKIKIINDDFLKINHEKIYSIYDICSNIPYYATGAILRKILSSKNQPKNIHLIVQKEVAERIIQKDGKNSILASSIKIYGEVKYNFTIKKNSFFPSPEVDSAMISITNISRKKINEEKINEEEFFKFLKNIFAHKRKQIASNISKKYKIKKEEIEKILESASLNKKARAEDMSLEEIITIYKSLSSKQYIIKNNEQH